MSHNGQKNKGELGQDTESLEEATNKMMYWLGSRIPWPVMRLWYRWRNKCPFCLKRGVHHKQCVCPKGFLNWSQDWQREWYWKHRDAVWAMLREIER